MFVAKRSSWWKLKFKRLLNPGSLSRAEQSGKKSFCNPQDNNVQSLVGVCAGRRFSGVGLKQDSWCVGGQWVQFIKGGRL